MYLFNEAGFHATSTAKIAKFAGVSNGAIFHHFPTKNELINEIYLDIRRAFLDYILEVYQPKGTTREKLFELGAIYVRWAMMNRDADMFCEKFYHSEFIDAETHARSDEMFRFIRELIEKGMHEGLFIIDDIELIINTFYYSMRGTIAHIVSNAPSDIQHSIEQGFALLMGGIQQTK